MGDSSSCRFKWTIESFSKLSVRKLYSDIFYVGDYKWRISIFPKRNNVDHLSMYLDVADSKTLPHGWSRDAHFSLSVINQIHSKGTVEKVTKHVFNASESDWGFTSFIPLSELNSSASGFILKDTCIVEAEVTLCGLDKEELKKMEEAEACVDNVIKEPTSVEAGEKSFSLPEFDALFTDIQKLLGGETSQAKYSSSFLHPPCSVEEIAGAKKLLIQLLNMDLASVIQLEKAYELKNSLSILLTTYTFPDNVVDRTTKFLADFDQSCEKYESAKQDLSEAQEDEKAVGELKTTLKQLVSESIPIRNQAETVDREIARLEKHMAERKAKKLRLSKRLEDLVGQATTSKQELVSAEEKMRLSAVKKEQAEKTVGDIERSWNTLKADCSVPLY